jgi:hypothetical protein
VKNDLAKKKIFFILKTQAFEKPAVNKSKMKLSERFFSEYSSPKAWVFRKFW